MHLVAEDSELQMRHREESDAEKLSKIANSKEIAKNMLTSFPYPYRLEHAREWIAMNRGTAATHFAVEVSGELAGGAGYDQKAGSHSHIATLGYWLGVDYWGKGYGTRLAGLLSDYIFSANEEIIRLEGKVYQGNPASKRVLEKNGFQYEGMQRKGEQKGGGYVDTYLYAKLRS